MGIASRIRALQKADGNVGERIASACHLGWELAMCTVDVHVLHQYQLAWQAVTPTEVPWTEADTGMEAAPPRVLSHYLMLLLEWVITTLDASSTARTTGAAREKGKGDRNSGCTLAQPIPLWSPELWQLLGLLLLCPGEPLGQREAGMIASAICRLCNNVGSGRVPFSMRRSLTFGAREVICSVYEGKRGAGPSLDDSVGLAAAAVKAAASPNAEVEAWQLAGAVLVHLERLALLHHNQRKLFTAVSGRLLAPLTSLLFPCRTQATGCNDSQDASVEHIQAAVREAGLQLLGPVLLHPAHLAGLAEMCAAEVKYASEASSKATPMKEGSTVHRTYLWKLFEAVEHGITASQGEDMRHMLMFVVWLEHAFVLALRKQQSELVDSSLSSTNEERGRGRACAHERHPASRVIVRDADFNLFSVLMHLLLSRLIKTTAAPTAPNQSQQGKKRKQSRGEVTARTRAKLLDENARAEGDEVSSVANIDELDAGALPEILGKRPKQADGEAPTAHEESWGLVAGGMAALLGLLKSDGIYRPTEDVSGKHRDLLKYVGEFVVDSYQAAQQQATAGALCACAAARVVAGIMGVEHRALQPRLESLWAIVWAAALADDGGVKTARLVAGQLVEAYAELRQLDVLLASLAASLDASPSRGCQAVICSPAFSSSLVTAVAELPPGQLPALVALVSQNIPRIAQSPLERGWSSGAPLYQLLCSCLQNLPTTSSTAVPLAAALDQLISKHLVQNLAPGLLSAVEGNFELSGRGAALLGLYTSALAAHASCVGANPAIKPLPGMQTTATAPRSGEAHEQESFFGPVAACGITVPALEDVGRAGNGFGEDKSSVDFAARLCWVRSALFALGFEREAALQRQYTCSCALPTAGEPEANDRTRQCQLADRVIAEALPAAACPPHTIAWDGFHSGMSQQQYSLAVLHLVFQHLPCVAACASPSMLVNLLEVLLLATSRGVWQGASQGRANPDDSSLGELVALLAAPLEAVEGLPIPDLWLPAARKALWASLTTSVQALAPPPQRLSPSVTQPWQPSSPAVEATNPRGKVEVGGRTQAHVARTWGAHMARVRQLSVEEGPGSVRQVVLESLTLLQGKGEGGCTSGFESGPAILAKVAASMLELTRLCSTLRHAAPHLVRGAAPGLVVPVITCQACLLALLRDQSNADASHARDEQPPALAPVLEALAAAQKLLSALFGAGGQDGSKGHYLDGDDVLCWAAHVCLVSGDAVMRLDKKGVLVGSVGGQMYEIVDSLGGLVHAASLHELAGLQGPGSGGKTGRKQWSFLWEAVLQEACYSGVYPGPAIAWVSGICLEAGCRALEEAGSEDRVMSTSLQSVMAGPTSKPVVTGAAQTLVVTWQGREDLMRRLAPLDSIDTGDQAKGAWEGFIQQHTSSCVFGGLAHLVSCLLRLPPQVPPLLSDANSNNNSDSDRNGNGNGNSNSKNKNDIMADTASEVLKALPTLVAALLGQGDSAGGTGLRKVATSLRLVAALGACSRLLPVLPPALRDKCTHSLLALHCTLLRDICGYATDPKPLHHAVSFSSVFPSLSDEQDGHVQLRHATLLSLKGLLSAASTDHRNVLLRSLQLQLISAQSSAAVLAALEILLLFVEEGEATHDAAASHLASTLTTASLLASENIERWCQSLAGACTIVQCTAVKCMESVLGQGKRFSLAPSEVLQLASVPAQLLHSRCGTTPLRFALYSGLCSLLAAAVRHRPRQLARGMASLLASVQTLLRAAFRLMEHGEHRAGLEMGKLYNAIHDSKEHMRSYCHILVAEYIVEAEACTQRLGSRQDPTDDTAAALAAPMAALRQGMYAIFGCCSRTEVQHVFSTFEKGQGDNLRSALTKLQEEYERLYRYTGKV